MSGENEYGRASRNAYSAHPDGSSAYVQTINEMLLLFIFHSVFALFVLVLNFRIFLRLINMKMRA